MKKISHLIIIFLISINLCSCLFVELNYDSFCISDDYVNTVLFEETSFGYSNNNNFIITSEDYMYNSKYYNNRSVFKEIMYNREFELLYWHNDVVITRNSDGLQKITFDDLSNKEPIVESDVLHGYYVNGFGEVIKGQNTDILLENNTYDIPVDNNDPATILAFIKDAKRYDDSNDEAVVLKVNYYLLKLENKLILRKVVNEKEVTDSVIDLDCELVKKGIFINNYIFLISTNGIYSYQLDTGYMTYKEIKNPTIVKQYEHYIYVVSGSKKIIMLDSELKEVFNYENNNEILGIIWHNDDFRSCLKYVENLNGILTLQFLDVKIG